jgi:hypothetical protein
MSYTFPTKTTTTALAVLAGLATNDDAAAAAATKLAEGRLPIFVGSGAHRTGALMGTAKTQELCNQPAMAVNAEDYLHLTGFAAGPEHVVISARRGRDRRARAAGRRLRLATRSGRPRGCRPRYG